MNNKQVRQMCIDFLMLHPPGVAYTCMQARQAMNKRWGFDIDHHEFAYAIEELVVEGKMVRVFDPTRFYPKFSVLESE
jgi:hypothetical protein